MYNSQNHQFIDTSDKGAPSHISVAPKMLNFSTIPTNLNPQVGPESTKVFCPQCNCLVTTTVRHRATTLTHFACLWLGCTCCCWLPYVMDTCRNANHYCPSCENFIGTYKA